MQTSTEPQTKNNWPTIKRWLFSTLISFLAGFALVMYNEIDNITLSSFSDGVFVGVFFSAVRAGVKAVLELIVNCNLEKFKKRLIALWITLLKI